MLLLAGANYAQNQDSIVSITDSINVDTNSVALPDVDTTDITSVKDTAINPNVTDTSSIVDAFIAEDTVKKIIRDIEIEFIKQKVEQSADSIYFNVCKFTNTTNSPISGKIRINVPNGWHLIANPSMEITLEANDSISLPVRLSIPRNAVGGMAYVIDASFEAKNGYYSGAAYVKIPLKTKWDMYLEHSTIYFNEYFETVQFDLHVKNKGNAPELINLQFEVGKLLDILEVNENKKDYFVKVPPLTDTVYTYTVTRAQLTEDKRQFYTQIWDESTIKVKGISGSTNKSRRDMLWVRDLDNAYIHNRQEKYSPLNVEANVFNLLSSNQPKLNLGAYGHLQFKGEHDLNYIFQARNLFYRQSGTLNYFENPNNYTFRIVYRWSDDLVAEIGEIFNNTMHSLRGWGVKASYKITDNDEVNASYIIGKFFPNWSSSVLYKRKINNLRVWGGATYEDNQYLHYRALSPEVGAAFSPYKNHTLRIGLMGTNAVFDNNQGVGVPADSTVLGFSYMASYSGVWKKFRFGGTTRNDQFNFIRVRPSNKINGYFRYMINAKSRINLIANYNSVSTSGYVYSPFYNGSYNRQAIYRATYLNRLSNSLVLEAGPMMRELNRLLIQSDTTAENFTNYFGGLFILSRIKMDEFQMLTPSLSAGYTYFRNRLQPDVTIRELPAINLGLSYVNRNMGASANYIYGPNFFVSEAFFENDEPINYETVQARLHHTRKFYEKNITWGNYLTYFLRLPSNRQNFVLSTMLDFKLPYRWSANMRANIFTNSVDEETAGVITHRNFSMNIGVKKSFDIPQPRIKYYDVTAICFNDLDGDGIRGEDEPLLSNIKLKLSRDREKNVDDFIRFGEQELVSNTQGEILLKDIPEGSYLGDFEPLFNLGNLYNAKGDNQSIEITQDMDLYIPYVESFQVNGKVSLIRDEFSDKGLINVNGVRVEAVNEKGETFAALTDLKGYYTLNVPQAGYFTVKVTNVFGEGFEIDKDKFLIQFDGFKHYTVDFTFYEGKKEVNFGDGQQFFNFKSLTETQGNSSNDDENTGATEDNPDRQSNQNDNAEIEAIEVALNAMQPKEALAEEIKRISTENEKQITDIVETNIKYIVEIGMIEANMSPDYTQKLKALQLNATPIKVNGIVIYASPVLETLQDAENLLNELIRVGFTEGVIAISYQGKVLRKEINE
ncbi:MAG: hypothetical protein N4A35_06000 [Flavobacteriales bacterium]|jgi:hypothetical protein|nr:hypothetical protein [Flavobacteriales bacterium]